MFNLLTIKQEKRINNKSELVITKVKHGIYLASVHYLILFHFTKFIFNFNFSINCFIFFCQKSRLLVIMIFSY